MLNNKTLTIKKCQKMAKKRLKNDCKKFKIK